MFTLDGQEEKRRAGNLREAAGEIIACGGGSVAIETAHLIEKARLTIGLNNGLSRLTFAVATYAASEKLNRILFQHSPQTAVVVRPRDERQRGGQTLPSLFNFGLTDKAIPGAHQYPGARINGFTVRDFVIDDNCLLAEIERRCGNNWFKVEILIRNVNGKNSVGLQPAEVKLERFERE